MNKSEEQLIEQLDRLINTTSLLKSKLVLLLKTISLLETRIVAIEKYIALQKSDKKN